MDFRSVEEAIFQPPVLGRLDESFNFGNLKAHPSQKSDG